MMVVPSLFRVPPSPTKAPFNGELYREVDRVDHEIAKDRKDDRFLRFRDFE
jgi:hypothetical protein